MSVNGRHPRLFGVLVTYRRPDLLADSLRVVVGQTRPLDDLVVVDNAPTPETRAVVESLAPTATYIPAPENLGPAGGLALGMERVLEHARDEDWIVTLDDDDPPPDAESFAILAAFATDLRARDRSVGAVGLEGVRFDRRRGRVVRIPDEELRGIVSVDSIGGDHCPCYSVEALRVVGVPRRDLFFGFEELELGLRLRAAGYSLFAPGPAFLASRAAQGGLSRDAIPSRMLGRLTWRRYYSLRNLVRILRDSGAPGAALRVTVVVGLGKPLANLVVDPRLALGHLRLNTRACVDAWSGRMGRTVEPS